MKRLSLKFINKGKPFILKNWTVMKHKTVLEKINKLSNTISEEDKDIEFQFFCIYESLKEIDPEIEIEDVKSLHPIMLTELFNLVYNQGKYDLYFREKGKKKGSK